MPMLFPLIAKFLALVVSGLVFRALASLGFAYVTYQGLGTVVDTIKGQVQSHLSSVPPEVSHILGLAQVDVAINIMIAGVVARLALAGMDRVSGTITALAIGNREL